MCFKLPVPILENSTCNVPHNCQHAQVLREASLFILDEASMISLPAFNAIDRLMRDITGFDVPFGGKVFLFGGDFRQTLPIVKRGTPTQIIENCILRSPIWQNVVRLQLTINRRVRPDQQDFADWLLRLGDGALPVKQHAPLQGCTQMKEQCVVDNLVEAIFEGQFNEATYSSRVILCPTNDDSLVINNQVLERLPNQQSVYLSADEVQSDDPQEAANYPVEFLNSITPSGMPPHKFTLKEGAVVMLIRNLNTSGGLYNDTRLIVRRLQCDFVDAEILAGFSSHE